MIRRASVLLRHDWLFERPAAISGVIKLVMRRIYWNDLMSYYGFLLENEEEHSAVRNAAQDSSHVPKALARS